MDKRKELIEQIKLVIHTMDKNYGREMEHGTIQLLYKRYKTALDLLEKNRDLSKINIIGGVRAYLDSYSDYRNPLLEELHKAEKLNKDLLM